MAKLLLACDDYIYCHKGKYYTANKEKYDFYLRYLRVFESLRLVARCIYEDDINCERILIDKEEIEYVPIPIYHGFNEYLKTYSGINSIVKNVALGCDAAIFRIPSGISYTTYQSVKKNNIPYAVEVVYDAYDGYKTSIGIKTKLINLYIDYYMRQMCYKANGVSCVTETHLQKRYYSKREDAFYSSYSSLSLPKSFYSSPRKYPNKRTFTIAHVANQIQYNGRKGHVELINVVRKLKDENIDVKLYFAGKEYNHGVVKLQEFAKNLNVCEEIHFLGYINRSELDKLLNDADIFVLPTKAEGLPRVIIEAMAKGLPCLTTDVSGNSELIEKRYLFDYNDIDSLKSLIKKLLTDGQLYEEASKCNYNNSLKYEASLLEIKRDAFYNNLKALIK